MNTLLRYLRVLLLLYAFFLIHEGGHALAFWLLGHPVKALVLGVGPTLGVTFAGIEWAIAPIPIGAYVVPQEDLPAWIHIRAGLAGPLAGLAVLFFHPANPFWKVCRLLATWAILGRKAVSVLLLDYADRVAAFQEKLDAPSEKAPEPGYLWRLPVLDVVHGVQNWSFWQICLVLSLANLLPLPPMDGARVLYFLLPKSDAVSVGYGVMTLALVFFSLVVAPACSMFLLWRKRRNEVQVVDRAA